MTSRLNGIKARDGRVFCPKHHDWGGGPIDVAAGETCVKCGGVAKIAAEAGYTYWFYPTTLQIMEESINED